MLTAHELLRIVRALVVVSWALAAPCAAQTLLGPPIDVDPASDPLARAEFPLAGALADGSTLVAWRSVEPSGSALRARRIDPSGALGPRMLLAAQVNGFETPPQLAAGRGGHLAVMWASGGTLLAQPFTPDGIALPLVDVGVVATASETTSTITVAPDGGFAAAWAPRECVPGQDCSVRLRRFSADGQAGATLRVAGSNGARDLASAWLGADRFVVLWMGASLASMPIEAQIFSADGSPMGGRIRVFSPTDSAGRYQWRPCVAAAADGRSWLGWHGGADPTAVFGRRFTADGRVASPKLRVSRRTRSAAAIGPPSLAIDPQSGWALFGWTERVAAGRLAMARLFHPMGNPAGGPFVVGAAQGGGASRLGRQASAAQGNGVFLLVFVDRDGHLVGQRAQADPRQPIRGRE